MGTNYYVSCPVCQVEGRHIGKSSAGWKFLFRLYPEEHIRSVKDWQRELKDKIIINEYREELSPQEFWSFVCMKQREKLDGGSVMVDGYCFEEREFS